MRLEPSAEFVMLGIAPLMFTGMGIFTAVIVSWSVFTIRPTIAPVLSRVGSRRTDFWLS